MAELRNNKKATNRRRLIVGKSSDEHKGLRTRVHNAGQLSSVKTTKKQSKLIKGADRADDRSELGNKKVKC